MTDKQRDQAWVEQERQRNYERSFRSHDELDVALVRAALPPMPKSVSAFRRLLCWMSGHGGIGVDSRCKKCRSLIDPRPRQWRKAARR